MDQRQMNEAASRRILVATDGSEGANRAVDYAAHRTKQDNAELLIVNLMGGYGLPERVFLAFADDQHALLESRVYRALGGFDALVFTAGIGEHAPEIRQRACENSAWLGLQIDEAANEAGGPRLTTADSRASAWAIPTDEDLMIAQHTVRIVET
jgi:hypothetical protein